MPELLECDCWEVRQSRLQGQAQRRPGAEVCAQKSACCTAKSLKLVMSLPAASTANGGKNGGMYGRGRSGIAALPYYLMIPPIFNILAEALSFWIEKGVRKTEVVVGFRRFITPVVRSHAFKYVRLSSYSNEMQATIS